MTGFIVLNPPKKKKSKKKRKKEIEPNSSDLEFITRSLDHAKDMQIHVRNVRIRAILGCGIFATAIAGFLMEKNPLPAISFFLLLSFISCHIDSGHRKLLHKWKLAHKNLEQLLLDYANCGVLDPIKSKGIVDIISTPSDKIPIRSKMDYASTSVVLFFVISILISIFIIIRNESIVNDLIFIRDTLSQFPVWVVGGSENYDCKYLNCSN